MNQCPNTSRRAEVQDYKLGVRFYLSVIATLTKPSPLDAQAKSPRYPYYMTILKS